MLRKLIRLSLIILAGAGMTAMLTSAIDVEVAFQESPTTALIALLWVAFLVGIIARGLINMATDLIVGPTISRFDR